MRHFFLLFAIGLLSLYSMGQNISEEFVYTTDSAQSSFIRVIGIVEKDSLCLLVNEQKRWKSCGVILQNKIHLRNLVLDKETLYNVGRINRKHIKKLLVENRAFFYIYDCYLLFEDFYEIIQHREELLKCIDQSYQLNQFYNFKSLFPFFRSEPHRINKNNHYYTFNTNKILLIETTAGYAFERQPLIDYNDGKVHDYWLDNRDSMLTVRIAIPLKCE